MHLNISRTVTFSFFRISTPTAYPSFQVPAASQADEYLSLSSPSAGVGLVATNLCDKSDSVKAELDTKYSS